MILNRVLPFREAEVLREMLPYLKRSVGYVEADIWSVDDALAEEGNAGFIRNIVETAEPREPSFEFRNV
ncbi:MAG TPA: hypothetical protein VGO47_05160 [Chlamydiales bacterium]|jgi:leucyl-tRNA synthetase|nr:hypothetical protein [Chlamydiales bacterium]